MSSPRRTFTLASVLLLAFAIGSYAAPDVPVAEVTVTPTSIQWKARGPSEGLVLAISKPDGEIFTRETKSSQLTITTQDLGGIPSDGTYMFDLQVTPLIPGNLKDKLKEARKNNDEVNARKLIRDAGLNRPSALSGAFSVLNGVFVSPNLDEGQGNGKSVSSLSPASNARSEGGPTVDNGTEVSPGVPRRISDQVIPDDLIVQGSECVGLDCVNNENFGFDTIRLKENNLRIHFDDTSVSAGFPANDWRIIANGSNSGDPSKFSIEDSTGVKTPFTITAGAATNSIFADSTGRIGLRTSVPVLDLQITTGNTPALRLEQTNASGFTAQTWDIGANEANFFVRDVTGGSKLPFRIRPGAPTSSIDIASDGDVGIGTSSPRSILEVKPKTVGSGLGLLVDDGTYGVYSFGGNTLNFSYSQAAFGDGWINYSGYQGGFSQFRDLRIGNGKGTTIVYFQGSSGNIGIGTASPTAPIEHSSGAKLTAGGAWQNASSREMKQDICELDSAEARETLLMLDPVKFAYKVEPRERHVGFIAEDVPNLVAAKDRKSLGSMDIVAVLTKVVKDQQKTIEELKARVDQLEKREHRDPERN